MDIVIAALALLLLSPLLIGASLLVLLDGGPVLFAHERVGRDGRSFRCWKLRTMVSGAETLLTEYLSYHPMAQHEWLVAQKLAFDPRATAIGRALRRSSIDEIPQLLNVLRGEMSLVGPRPVTREELLRYGDEAMRYMSVRPGLTGPWQISGRSGVGYQARIALDVEYARHHSLIGDILILLKTPRVVFSRRGAS